MKKNLLFISFLFFGIVNGQEPEIPNAGFETWETVTIYESPKGWMTTVDMSWLFKGTATRSEDSKVGDYALMLETLPIAGFDEIMPGIAIYGEFPDDEYDDEYDDEGFDIIGMPWNKKVDKFHFTAKYDIKEKDTAYVWVLLFSEDEEIGSVLDFIVGSADSWTDIELDIEYEVDGIPEPDAMAIIISSSSLYDSEDGEYPAAGSWILADNIHFSYEGSVIDLPNGDFSEWDEYSREDPEGWISSNFELSVYDERNVTQTTDAFSGTYAARMETIDHEDLGLVQGVLKLGENYLIDEGIPFTENPEFVGGTFKHSTTIGSGSFELHTFTEQEYNLASIDFMFPGAEEYTRFVSWQIPHYGYDEPDALYIEIRSGYSAGSTLYIDDLEFFPGRVVNFEVINRYDEPLESTVSIQGVDPVLLGAPGWQFTDNDGILNIKLADGEYTCTVRPTEEGYEDVVDMSFTVDGDDITLTIVVEEEDDTVINIQDADTDKVYFEGDYFEVKIENPEFPDGITPAITEGVFDIQGNFIQENVLDGISVTEIDGNNFTISGNIAAGVSAGVIGFELNIDGLDIGPLRVIDRDLYDRDSGSDFGMAIVGVEIPSGEISVVPDLSEFDDLYDTGQDIVFTREDHGSIEFGAGLNVIDDRNELEALQGGLNLLSNPDEDTYYIEINPVSLSFLSERNALVTIEGYELSTFSIRKTDFDVEAGYDSPKDHDATASAELTDNIITFTVEGFSRYTVLEDKYVLTLEAEPAEGGTVTDITDNGPYPSETEVTVKAEANQGYVFVNWVLADDEVSTGAEFNYVMPGNNVTLTANFETAKYTVSFTVKKENEEPVEGAEIIITQNDTEVEVITTGADGKAEGDLPEGDYNYAVTADDYEDDSGSFTVADEDKDIFITLLHVGFFDAPSLSEKIKVYPNPSDGLFHVEYSAGEVKTITLEVMSVTGNLVYIREFRGIGTLKETIDLQHINKGVYLLRLRENGKISTIKMIFR